MKNYIAFFSFLLVFSGTALSGGFDKDQKKRLEDANIYFEIGDFKNALEIYKELYQIDSANREVAFRLGVSYFNLRQPFESLSYFEQAKSLGEQEAYYFLGRIYHLQQKFDEEIRSYQLYKNIEERESATIEEVNRLIESAEYAKLLMERPENVDIVNLGPRVNSEYHEYAPLVYGAENELYFTSRRPSTTGGGKDPYGFFFEDIYHSKKEHGNWTDPRSLDAAVNTPTNDACVGISPDGQIMYLFRTNDDLVSGDLYEVKMTSGGWGEPVKLGSQINSDYVESSVSISNDEHALYFSSNRPGGYGGKDIYRSIKLPTGSWSLPLNLGPTINTPYDEESPFIHVDNKTLYFSSSGHKTIGGFDIFESEQGEDGLWSEPRNLGYPVNTVFNDLDFVMSPDKLNGYYSSAQEGGFGGQDVYVINFKLYAQVLSVVKGGVFTDGKSTIPVGAKVTLIDSQTRNIQGIYKTNEQTGKFIMVVTPELEYTMIVEAEGYHTYSKQVSFSGENLFSSTISEINLVPTEVAGYE